MNRFRFWVGFFAGELASGLAAGFRDELYAWRRAVCKALVVLVAALGTVSALSEPSPAKPVGQVSSLPLKLANSHSWAPMSYVEAGVAKGMLVDFWRLYEHHNGQPVVFHLVDWGESIQAVRSGAAEVHAGLLKSPEREAFFLFTRPIFPLVTALFADLSQRDAAMAMKLPVGVVSKSYEAEYMGQKHRDVDLVFFDNSRELVQAAHEGLVQAFVIDLPTGTHFVREFGDEKRIGFVKAVYSKPIHAAVSINNPKLLTEIQAGIDRIPRDQIRAIAERKPVNLSDNEKRFRELPWLALKALIFLLVLALVWWAIKGLFGFGSRS